MIKRLKTIFQFLILGPLIGSLIMILFFVVTSVYNGKFRIDESEFVLVFIPFGYFFGFVPALSTGVAVALIDKVNSKSIKLILSTLFGFISTFCFYYYIDDKNKIAITLMFSLVGAFSAFLISYINYLRKR